MKIKTLILGSAAVLVTGGAAMAADLPAAEPVEYVKVCDTFGTGYFYIPGTETCLRIGGNVRYHLRYAEPVLKAARTENHTFTRAEARLQFDARTMTEYGLLRSFIDVRFRATSGTGFTVAQAARFERAFIQFGGLTAGRAESFFDFFPGYANGPITDTFYSYLPTNVLAYTFAFGNGFSATLAAEDGTFRHTATTIDGPVAGVNYYGGHTTPDLVAALRVDQGWGSAQISGALHQLRFTTATTADAEFGWAVQGGLTVNLPMIADGDEFSVQAAYTEGAPDYVGINESTFISGVNLIDGTITATNFTATKAWSVAAGFLHNWTPQFSTAITASYIDVDNPIASVERDWDAYNVILTNTYTPVRGLEISLEAAYQNEDVHGIGTTFPGVVASDVDYFSGEFRIQRSF
ncbi:MAG TPA: porin [Hyphomicrobiales bacterium]|nr:porin [Kaistiaceae bacterium]HQF31145.1 porin [Hyphomicrobiales bacterium]